MLGTLTGETLKRQGKNSSRRGKTQDFACRLTPFRNKAGHTKLHWHFKGMTCLPQHFLTKSMTPNFAIPRQLKARMLSKSQVPQNTRKDLKPFPISLGRDRAMQSAQRRARRARCRDVDKHTVLSKVLQIVPDILEHPITLHVLRHSNIVQPTLPACQHYVRLLPATHLNQHKLSFRSCQARHRTNQGFKSQGFPMQAKSSTSKAFCQEVARVLNAFPEGQDQLATSNTVLQPLNADFQVSTPLRNFRDDSESENKTPGISSELSS